MPSSRRQLSEKLEPANIADEKPDDISRRKIARWILQRVNDPKMHPTIAEKVAREIVAENLDKVAICELLDGVDDVRRRGAFTKGPGAYFVASLKRLFAYEEIPWTRNPRS